MAVEQRLTNVIVTAFVPGWAKEKLSLQGQTLNWWLRFEVPELKLKFTVESPARYSLAAWTGLITSSYLISFEDVHRHTKTSIVSDFTEVTFKTHAPETGSTFEFSLSKESLREPLKKSVGICCLSKICVCFVE